MIPNKFTYTEANHNNPTWQRATTLKKEYSQQQQQNIKKKNEINKIKRQDETQKKKKTKLIIIRMQTAFSVQWTNYCSRSANKCKEINH